MHNTLTKTATRIARWLGYEVVASWRLDQFALEQHLRTLFRTFSIDTVLDVGANTGQYRDFLRRRVGFEGTIHSFEPVSRLAQLLGERAQADPGWHIHRYALGDSDTSLEINVTASDTFSSFLQADVPQDSRFASSMAVRSRECVEVKRADTVWRSLVQDPKKLYVKVDTQGFDMAVLRGGKQLLTAVPALQFELPMQRLYQGTAHYLDILREMEDTGFQVSGLFPITTDQNLQVIEFDCVMVAMR